MAYKHSEALPRLELIAAERLVLHEGADPRRVAKLAKRLQDDRRLMNPPIVTPLPDSDEYVVLDGANRVSALKELGARHVVAQIVHYDDPGVELDTWYHVVADIDRAELLHAMQTIPGVCLEESTQEEARKALAISDAVAYVIMADAVHQVRACREALRNDIHILNALVSTYKGKASIYRASNDAYEKQAPSYPTMVALVVFPSYRPADILRLVRAGERVPSGITRHIIPMRALRINIPLSVLMADEPLEAKQAWLQEWWRERLGANAVRYYSESTFLFDE